MYWHILKIILVNLYHYRLQTFINLFGLSISFCCFLLLFLYLKNELTVDQHFTNHDRIYRVVGEVDVGSQHTMNAKTGSLVAPLLAQDYEQFTNYVRFYPSLEGTDMVLHTEDKALEWGEEIYNADSSVFDIFDHRIVEGDSSTALVEPRSLAISERLAGLLFDEESALGKTIGMNAPDNAFTVKLVFADLPDNTSLQYDMLISENSPGISDDARENYERGILNFNYYTYFLLPEQYDPADFESISERFFNRHVGTWAQQMFPGQNAQLTLQLQPLDDLYFDPPFQEDIPKGNRFVVMALVAVAFFILGVASVNYMTLATAGFSQRAHELGVRRTLGARTSILVLQFLTEGVLFSLLAFLIGLSLTELLLSTALDEVYLGISGSLAESGLLWQLLLIAIVVGLVSGAYPAYYYSSVRPLDIFSPFLRISRIGLSLRSVLVGLQMLVSISVIASALIMYNQIDYLNSRPLGFNKDNKLVLNVNVTRNSSEYQPMKNQLLRHSGIHHVSMVDALQGAEPYSQPFAVKNGADEEIIFQGFSNYVDENYLDTFDIPLLQGRNLPTAVGDSTEISRFPILVNENLVRTAGWADPIGQIIRMPAYDYEAEVVGVFDDFHFVSLYEEIEPFALDLFYDDYRWQRHLILDFDPGQLSAVLARAETVMRGFNPSEPFQYSFLADSLESLYREENRQMQLIMAGAVVCVLISLLGVFGMTAFALDRSTKEIAIRRVLGGTMTRIIAVKFRGLFALIMIAAIFSSMLVFYTLGIWLEQFAYRVPFDPVLLFYATAMVLVLTVLTIALYAISLARARPVLALRYE